MKHSEVNWPPLIALGRRLVGKEYNFGAEVNLNDPDPDHIKALDCSELTQWLSAQATSVDGKKIDLGVPDGSQNQAKVCQRVQGLSSEFPEKLLIWDFGFKWIPETKSIHHVGVYIGNDIVLEAKGRDFGIVLTPVIRFMASTHFAFWGRLKTLEDA